MNCASNTFILCAIQMIFLKHFVVRVTRLTNCLTESFRNINSRIPTTLHISSISVHVSQICCATQKVRTWICTFSILSHVLSRFEIVEHECDAIFFVFIICSTFGLILAPVCSFFLYHRTFLRILGNDFISKRAHEAKMIRRPLRSASFTIRCNFAFVPILTLRIARNYYKFLSIHLREIAR